jgi:hypothetical protein
MNLNFRVPILAKFARVDLRILLVAKFGSSLHPGVDQHPNDSPVERF